MTVEYIKLSGQTVTATKFYPQVPEMESKLFAAGWVKVVSAAEEPFDSITQIRARATYTLSEKNLVTRGFPVTDKPLVEAQAAKTQSIRDQAHAAILKQYPIWKQLNCSLGVYSSDVVDSIKLHIKSMVAQSNTCEAAVESAKEVNALRGISYDISSK